MPTKGDIDIHYIVLFVIGLIVLFVLLFLARSWTDSAGSAINAFFRSVFQ